MKNSNLFQTTIPTTMKLIDTTSEDEHLAKKSNVNEKYLNLRKLNSNRIQKYNYLNNNTPNSNSSNEFLDYFNLIELKPGVKNSSLEIKTFSSPIQPEPIPSDQISKFDLILKNSTEKNESELNFDRIKFNLPENKKNNNRIECVYEYLSKLGAFSVAPEAFQHVQTYLKQNQSQTFKCELIYSNNFYWIVKIKHFQSSLYQLKFVKDSPGSSLNNSSENHIEQINHIGYNGWFFCLIESNPNCKLLLNHLKPLGWCKKNSTRISKKPTIHTESNDLSDLLKSLEITDLNDDEFYDLSETQKANNQIYTTDSLCEIIENDLLSIGRIAQNISGRLQIELFGTKENQWLFYLDNRVKPLGWAQRYSLEYKNLDKCPLDVSEKLEHENCAKKNTDKNFRLNYLMECLYKNKFYIAQVIESVNNEYLKIKLDSQDSNVNNLVFIYSLEKNANFHQLFPCKWCSANNLKLELPYAWPADKKFDWDEYVQIKKLKCDQDSNALVFYQTKSTDVHTMFNWSRNLANLSEKFKVGYYLECARDESIYLAQIKAKVAHLIFLKIFESSQKEDENRLFVFTVDSMDLFPVSWCELNNYTKYNTSFLNRIKFEQTKILFNDDFNKIIRPDFGQINILSQFINKEEWCDNIYLNTNCFNCGPYFLKSKLCTLPKCFGPGPIVLVIYKLIQMLINISEKPLKLVKIFQASRRNFQNQNNNNSINSNMNNSLTNNNFPNSNVNSQMTTSNSSNFTNNLVFNRNEKLKYMRRVRLKAKDKGKSLYKEFDFEICTNRVQLEEYLSNLCIKLNCCTKMISLDQEVFPNYDEYFNSNKHFINETKCCLLCTINYFSGSNSIESNKNVTEQEPKNVIKKLSLINNNHKKVNCDSDGNSSLKPKKTKNPNPNQNDVNSPIKTRLNLRRQNYLLSLKQQQQQQTQKLEEEKHQRLKSNSDIIKSLDDSEPLIKKPKKMNMNKSLEEKTCHTPSSNGLTQSQSTSSLNSHTKRPSTNTSDHSNNFITSSKITNLITSTGTCLKNNLITLNSSNHNMQQNDNNNVNISNSTNPICWTSKDICRYLLDNKFDSNLVYLIEEHEIDGQSFLMLNLPTIQNYMNLKLGPAIKLAHLVEKLKIMYFQKFKDLH